MIYYTYIYPYEPISVSTRTRRDVPRRTDTFLRVHVYLLSRDFVVNIGLRERKDNY